MSERERAQSERERAESEREGSQRERAQHTLDERIAAVPESLSPSAAKVARFLADNREEAAFLSAADIAGRLDVSDATVIRAVQALGYAGLPELRHELRDAVRERRTPALRYLAAQEAFADSGDALLDHVFALRAQTLATARSAISGPDFEKARALLAGADRVVVFGDGPRGPLADYFVQSVRRLGRSALPLTASGSALADGLMELRPGDVVLMLGYDSLTVEMGVVLDRAAELGVRSVLLTNRLALALRDRCTVTLSTGLDDRTEAPTVVGTLAVLEALVTGLIGADRSGTVASLSRLHALRLRLGGVPLGGTSR